MRRTSLLFACALFLSIPSIASARAGAVVVEVPRYSSGWFLDLNRFSESAHNTLSCDACHGDMNEAGRKHPGTREATDLKLKATQLYDYHRCKTCHRESYERYLRGAHAKALAEEKKAAPSQGPVSDRLKAPTCGECHSAHYAKSHLSRVAMGKEMTGVCGACHAAQKATYLENYHGKTAVNLGDAASAYCTDCHGAHDCVSLKDREAALAACQRCHPDAGERFAQFVIHPTTEGLARDNKGKQKHVAIIKLVTLIMTIIVILVVGFFYGHSFLWLLRELHEKLRKH
ncbi:MAG: cytochrome c family protein [Deltaproteobacteria bacterium]|nr:cytochrome c family protein [Deltaproteobacteria bacterium]